MCDFCSLKPCTIAMAIPLSSMSYAVNSTRYIYIYSMWDGWYYFYNDLMFVDSLPPPPPLPVAVPTSLPPHHANYVYPTKLISVTIKFLEGLSINNHTGNVQDA